MPDITMRTPTDMQVPAIVLRGLFDPAASAALVRRLPPHPYGPSTLVDGASNGTRETQAGDVGSMTDAEKIGVDGRPIGKWELRMQNYSTLGVDLHRKLKAGPGVMASATAQWQPFFDASSLTAAHVALHEALRSLGAGRSVQV